MLFNYLIYLLFFNSAIFGINNSLLGGVYPNIYVKNNTFWVEYYNALDNRNYRIVYSKEGSVLKEKKEIVDSLGVLPKFSLFGYKLSGDAYIKDGSIYLIKHGLTSVPQLYIIENNIVRNVVNLRWPNKDEYSVNDFIVFDNNEIMMIGKKKDSGPIYFIWFSNYLTSEASIREIGLLCGQMSYPAISEIVKSNNIYYVCWVDLNKNIMLTSWDPKRNFIKNINIENINEADTRPSVGVIDNNLLIAYHASKNKKDPSELRIIYRKLNDLMLK